MEKQKTLRTLIKEKIKEEMALSFGSARAFILTSIYAITVGFSRWFILGRNSAMNYFLELITDSIIVGVLFYIGLYFVNRFRVPYLVSRDLLEKNKNYENLLDNIKNARPNIIPIRDGFYKLESPFPLWSGNTHTDYLVHRFYLSLQNVGNVDTTSVYATVAFYKMNCKELKELSHTKAFWYNDKPRIQRSGSETHIIKALSNPEGICLVIKKEEDLYVFSDDSYFPGTANINLVESMKISVNKVYACVKITAQNLSSSQVFWVKITNRKDKQPEFKIMDVPPC